MASGIETERKFLLPSLPAETAAATEVLHVEQGYLEPAGLRVRVQGSRCFLTVKAGNGLHRQEWEEPVPRWVAEELWSATEGRRLSKTRYVVEEAGQIYEIDAYLGVLEGLFVAELSGGDVENGTLPPWLDGCPEVTDDPRYGNRVLAARGLPAGPAAERA